VGQSLDGKLEVQLAQNGVIVIQVLIANEIMAGAKHFYPNEINGCQSFLPNNGGLF
jgi:hypothetical protein